MGHFGVRSRDAPEPSSNTRRRLGGRTDSALSGSVPSIVSRGVSSYTDTASRARFLGAILLLRSAFRLSAL